MVAAPWRHRFWRRGSRLERTIPILLISLGVTQGPFFRKKFDSPKFKKSEVFPTPCSVPERVFYGAILVVRSARDVRESQRALDRRVERETEFFDTAEGTKWPPVGPSLWFPPLTGGGITASLRTVPWPPHSPVAFFFLMKLKKHIFWIVLQRQNIDSEWRGSEFLDTENGITWTCEILLTQMPHSVFDSYWSVLRFVSGSRVSFSLSQFKPFLWYDSDWLIHGLKKEFREIVVATK